MKAKSPYPYLVALAFVAPLWMWLVVGCPGLTIDNSYHNHIQLEKVLVKDTAEVKRLTKDNYWLRQELYKKPKVKRDTVYVDAPVIGKFIQQPLPFFCDTIKEHEIITQPLNRPIMSSQFLVFHPDTCYASFEYNARTDVFPPRGSGKRLNTIRGIHNKEWEDLPHRASEDSLFKPK